MITAAAVNIIAGNPYVSRRWSNGSNPYHRCGGSYFNNDLRFGSACKKDHGEYETGVRDYLFHKNKFRGMTGVQGKSLKEQGRRNESYQWPQVILPICSAIHLINILKQ
jgi:hypothetical protein